MRYVGGKHRIAPWVATHCLSFARRKQHYLEPFVGSGACFAALAPHFKTAVAADAHKDLILLYQALVAGWDPPEHVTREEYCALKNQPPSALRGIVGFGASFSGKWFDGYVDTCWDAHYGRPTLPYLACARRSLLKIVPVLSKATIVCADYREHTVGSDTFVYADPPLLGHHELRRNEFRLQRILEAGGAMGRARSSSRRIRIEGASRMESAGGEGAEIHDARGERRREHDAPRGAVDCKFVGKRS